MPSLAPRLGYLAVVAAGTLLVASTLAEVPRLRLLGTTVPTQSLLGAVGGLITLSVAFSEYRGGNRRTALHFGLLGVGVALALSSWQPMATVGAFLTLLSVPVAWQTDRWLREWVVDAR